MKILWLISILLFTTFSEGRRGRKMRKSSSLYSRMKKDLAGVEKRIHGELMEILDTVTELKDITEDALIDSREIEEVEPETIHDEEKGGVLIGKSKYTNRI